MSVSAVALTKVQDRVLEAVGRKHSAETNHLMSFFGAAEEEDYLEQVLHISNLVTYFMYLLLHYLPVNICNLVTYFMYLLLHYLHFTISNLVTYLMDFYLLPYYLPVTIFNLVTYLMYLLSHYLPFTISNLVTYLMYILP